MIVEQRDYHVVTGKLPELVRLYAEEGIAIQREVLGGFLGAFTTYSTLAVDTDLLLRDGYAPVAVLYAVGTVVVGFLATSFGIWAATVQRRGTSR